MGDGAGYGLAFVQRDRKTRRRRYQLRRSGCVMRLLREQQNR
jgi:hypothetical protein